MMNILKGIKILSGIILLFISVTACASGRGYSKNGIQSEKYNRHKDAGFSNNNEEFIDDRNISYRGKSDNNDRSDQGLENIEFNDNETSMDDNNDNGKLKTEGENFYQKGMASWYGREFDGRRTASGETFDMKKYTAAHKTLPFGTNLLVTNIENGKTVNVIINDRGPYRDGRIIDLSYAAAGKIDIVSKGEAMVGLKILRKGNEEKIASRNNNNFSDHRVSGANFKEEEFSSNRYNEESEYSDDQGEMDNKEGRYDYMIQAGAFYSRRNAERLQKQIEVLFNNPIVIIKDNDMYKIRIKEIKSKNEAAKYKRKLEEENISSFMLEN